MVTLHASSTHWAVSSEILCNTRANRESNSQYLRHLKCRSFNDYLCKEGTDFRISDANLEVQMMATLCPHAQRLCDLCVSLASSAFNRSGLLLGPRASGHKFLEGIALSPPRSVPSATLSFFSAPLRLIRFLRHSLVPAQSDCISGILPFSPKTERPALPKGRTGRPRKLITDY